MKIQTTNLGKGGGGKTTDTFNEGDWLHVLRGLEHYSLMELGNAI